MGPSGLLLGVINIGIVAAGWILVGLTEAGQPGCS